MCPRLPLREHPGRGGRLGRRLRPAGAAAQSRGSRGGLGKATPWRRGAQGQSASGGHGAQRQSLGPL
eukprot:8348925-Alexandrium_andersonii.AAC.1